MNETRGSNSDPVSVLLGLRKEDGVISEMGLSFTWPREVVDYVIRRQFIYITKIRLDVRFFMSFFDDATIESFCVVFGK